MYHGFQELFPNMLRNFRDYSLDLLGSNSCLPNNTILLDIIDMFDPNPMLVNIIKLKPYKFIEDIIL